MPFDFSSFLLNPWMLLGLPVLAIPPIIHLLNRRRYQVVDWGAMQFLQVSEVTRRRLMLEELLLMFLRIALLGVLVFGLAGPFLPESVAAKLSPRGNRDVVLVFDGSYSMGSQGNGPSPHEAAKEWALGFLGDLRPGDTVAVLQAKQQVVPVVGELSHDLLRVRERIEKMAGPAGGCDWRLALEAAHALLDDPERSQHGTREIILLGDGQRFGWADKDSLFRWNLLASTLGYKGTPRPGARPHPRLWVVNLAPNRPAEVPNWALNSLRGNRPVVPVGRQVTFRTDLELFGQGDYQAPHRVRLGVDLEADGNNKWVRDLEPPKPPTDFRDGKLPFSFKHQFGTAGSHLVSVLVEPDLPAGERPVGYTVKDQVPGDNRQDFAVEVLRSIPVLLIDGDPNPAAPRRGSDFLRKALSPAGDSAPAVGARVVSVSEFGPSQLAAKKPEDRPRVLVLCNVARLTATQQAAVEQFLADGGGVLVTLGGRVEADAYNKDLYRDGQGWLPAKLEGTEGDESRPRGAVRPVPETFDHPALDLFKDDRGSGLAEARFPRWWKLATPGREAKGVTVGTMRSATTEYPFLVERVDRKSPGRVLLCPVPLDDSWGSNLPGLRSGVFLPLAHELVYYLAGARSAEFNLEPGQPIRFRPGGDGSLEGYTLQPPGGEARPLSTSTTDPATYPVELKQQPQGTVVYFAGTKETGVYQLQTPGKQTVYYVVQRNPRESDLMPCSDEDRAHVKELLPVEYENDRGKIVQAVAGAARRQEIWWWLLLGLVVLLCGEVWMTRRMALNR